MDTQDKPRRFCHAVPPAQAGQTVEQLLLGQGYSKRLIIALKQTADGLCVAGQRVRSTRVLHSGETLVVTLPPERAPARRAPLQSPLADRLQVLYEDADIIVYNKPAGLPCHRSGGHLADTLENASAGVFRAVNRLDKDTSGALLAAKHQLAAARLWQQVQKSYLAVVCGAPPRREGLLELPLRRAVAYEPLQVVDWQAGKPARTAYKTLCSGGGYTLLRCTLHTGRMHQIRAQMAAVGCPLAGDTLYGGSEAAPGRQALHCEWVAFAHPCDGRALRIVAPLATDMAALLRDNGLQLPEND